MIFLIVLDLKQVKIAFGAETLLENISIAVGNGERLGLIGANGAGKTTLFKAILGQQPIESGSITTAKGISVGYLAQMQQPCGSRTVLEEVLDVFAPIFEMENELRRMEEQMAQSHEDYEALSDRYSALRDRYEQADGYSVQSRATGVLRGLGLGDVYFNRPADTLSGGERTRLSIARLLLENHDILMLDEPTNHLDLSAVQWLTDFLCASKSTIIIISHDRYLLDKLCTQIAELENGRLYTYKGNYTAYRQKRAEQKRIEQKTYDEQQKEIARQEEIIQRYRSFNREKSIRAAESREKALERMERVEAPEQTESMRLAFSPARRSGTEVLTASDLSKRYGEKTLFCGLNFSIRSGQRIALIGPNGAGKTTLFKLLLNLETPDTGALKWGAQVDAGYYAQQQEGLDPKNSVMDEIWLADRRLSQTQIRNTAASMLFRGEEVFKPISLLSGGEKARVSLCKLSLGGYNFLMMDEPTNHLDMDSREILEDALSRFEGTFFVISHDRYFINRTADAVWELKDGVLTCYEGNYDAYREASAPRTEENSAPVMTKTAEAKLRAKERQSRTEAKAKAQALRETEREIEHTEEEIAAMQERFADQATYSDASAMLALQQEYKNAEQKLAALYERWETLSEEG